MELTVFDKLETENTSDYIERMRSEFYKTMSFVKFKGKKIVLGILERDGHDTFDHITSNGKDQDRKFDYNRAKYTLNIPLILEKLEYCDEIITFKDGNRDIVYLFEENQDFIIVLEKEESKYILITAYKVNRSSSRNYYYKEKILEISKMKYSHSYNFTKMYKLDTQIKEIYIDETVKVWIEDFYTQDIIYRIIATAIKQNCEKIYFMVYKNHHHVPQPDKKSIYLISKYSNTLQDKKLLETMRVIENAKKGLDTIYHLDDNNNLKLIEIYLKLETHIRQIAKKYGRYKLLYTCFKTIQNEVGYFAPNMVRYKLTTQFPEIVRELLSGEEERMKDVYNKYKVGYDKNVIITDGNLEKYYKRYLLGFLVEFSKTIYGTEN